MSKKIAYRINARLETADIIAVFQASAINRPIHDAGRIARMFAASPLTVSAWDGDKLVGVARALTDFSYCCYLSDIAVDLDYQRRGIGATLVAEIKTAIGPECNIVLLSAPDALDYYPKLGFKKIDNGFVLVRSC